MVNDKLSSLVAWRSSGPNQQDGHEAEVGSSAITHTVSRKEEVCHI